MKSAGGPGAGGRRSWRKLNNALHRDVGYLIVGLTVVHGASGLAVNHRADWNPRYRLQKRALHIEPIRATWIADLYAVALLFVAGTGPFVLKGRTGITGRGAWLTALGIAIPVVCRLLLAAGSTPPA